MDGVRGNLLSDPDDSFDIEAWRPKLKIPAREQHVALLVEAVSSRALSGHYTAWADLCTRALESNVFLEPAFALPLMQHVDPRHRPDALLVWEENGPTSFGRLVGLIPVLLPRGRLPRAARAFHDKQIALGTPLLDADRAEDAFVAILGWLRDHDRRPPALLLTTIATDGPFHALAERVCAARGLPLHHFEAKSRAILQARTVEPSPVATAASAKRRKEWRRQHRRLSESGTRTWRSATTPADVARTAERFLALEHNGWKGRRGTSLLADPHLATFVRTMTRLMAHEGKCRIDTLEIDGEAVAMGVILTVGDRAHFWKTAYDERFAGYSPGVQFTNELADRQHADARVTTTDSCAMPDHAMIDRLWPGRMPVADLMIGLPSGSARSFVQTCRIETVQRALRAAAKNLRLRLRRRAH